MAQGHGVAGANSTQGPLNGSFGRSRTINSNKYPSHASIIRADDTDDVGP
jgi:hypothetical protein